MRALPIHKHCFSMSMTEDNACDHPREREIVCTQKDKDGMASLKRYNPPWSSVRGCCIIKEIGSFRTADAPRVTPCTYLCKRWEGPLKCVFWSQQQTQGEWNASLNMKRRCASAPKNKAKVCHLTIGCLIYPYVLRSGQPFKFHFLNTSEVFGAPKSDS